jgi:hypothetical protein
MRRTLLALCGLAALVAGLHAQARPPAKDGVLLGFSDGEGYHTMWLTSSGDAWAVQAQGDGLLVPRASGFWWVGVHRDEDDWFRVFAWATPADLPLTVDRPKWEHEEDLKQFGGSHQIAIEFVGPDYVSLSESFETYGPSLAYNHILLVHSLDDLAKPAVGDVDFEGRSIEQILGPGSDGALEKAARDEARAAKQRGDELADIFDGASMYWSIGRHRGHWAVTGRATHGSGAARGYAIDFTVPLRIPAKVLGGADSYAVNWADLLDRVPDASDVVRTPGRSALIVLAPGRLWSLSLMNGRLGSARLIAQLSGEERLVMAQGAVGSHVDR